MNQVIDSIRRRRAIRKYDERQIPQGVLQAILEAGLYAPSAGGRQSCIIAVCQDAAVNAQLGALNRAAFYAGGFPKNMRVSDEQPSIADDPSLPSAFYGAPTVLTLFAPDGYAYADIDCAVTAQNIMLAAHSLGVGSCMVGRAESTFLCEVGRKLLADWGIGENMQPRVHVALGYAASSEAEPKPRKPGRIIKLID